MLSHRPKTILDKFRIRSERIFTIQHISQHKPPLCYLVIYNNTYGKIMNDLFTFIKYYNLSVFIIGKLYTRNSLTKMMGIGVANETIR